MKTIIAILFASPAATIASVTAQANAGTAMRRNFKKSTKA
jgi:hypothetical protein